MYENTQTGNQLSVSVIFALPSCTWNINAALGQKLKVLIHLHFATVGRQQSVKNVQNYDISGTTQNKKYHLNKLTGTKENTLKFGKKHLWWLWNQISHSPKNIKYFIMSSIQNIKTCQINWILHNFKSLKAYAMYCILLQQSPSYVGVNELHLCRQLIPVHIDILFQREECLLKFICYIPYCIQSVHNFLNRPCMSTSCYASLCQSLTAQWLLLLSSQLYRSWTDYSIALRMATCFIHTNHHKAINCYKNVNLKILKS